MTMNTKDKEITDQPSFNHFDLKSNLTCNTYIPLNTIPDHLLRKIRARNISSVRVFIRHQGSKNSLVTTQNSLAKFLLVS